MRLNDVVKRLIPSSRKVLNNRMRKITFTFRAYSKGKKIRVVPPRLCRYRVPKFPVFAFIFYRVIKCYKSTSESQPAAQLPSVAFLIFRKAVSRHWKIQMQLLHLAVIIESTFIAPQVLSTMNLRYKSMQKKRSTSSVRVQLINMAVAMWTIKAIIT